MTLEEIKQKLKSTLKESRYMHSLSVAETAMKLAGIYGADVNKAYLAGLVHDCAKCYDDEVLLKKIKQYDIELDPETGKSPQLWHSFVGAYEARDVYGIDDEEIFDAIYYHTIGKEEMSLMTAIIYLADAVEPLRDYPGVDQIRKESEISLNKAIYLYTKGTIEFVIKRGAFLHPNAVKVMEYYSRLQ